MSCAGSCQPTGPPPSADSSNSRPRRTSIRFCRCCATRPRTARRIRARRCPTRRSAGRRTPTCSWRAPSTRIGAGSDRGPRACGRRKAACPDAAAAAIAAGWLHMDGHRRAHPGAITRALRAGHRRRRAAYQPHAVQSADGEVRMLFRDHGLSDLIGFTYQCWPAGAAVDDFVGARARHRRASGGPGGRDGDGAGHPRRRERLGALRRRRAAVPASALSAPGRGARISIRCTMRRAAEGPAAAAARRLFAGLVDQCRLRHLDRPSRRPPRLEPAARTARSGSTARAPELGAESHRDRASTRLLAAEGSDWFWWYGDDHSSAHDREFDALFRQHLRRAYRAWASEVPDDLHRTNISTDLPGDDVAAPDSCSSPSAAAARLRVDISRALARCRWSGPPARCTGRRREVVGACDVGVATAGLAVWIDLIPPSTVASRDHGRTMNFRAFERPR